MSDKYTIEDYHTALVHTFRGFVQAFNRGYPMSDAELSSLVDMNVKHELQKAHEVNLARAVVGFVADSGPATGKRSDR